MTVNIPGGFMQVIQPFRLATASKDWTTTYAVAGDNPEGMITEADTLFRDTWLSSTDSNFQLLPAVGYFRESGGGLLLVESTNAAAPGGSAKTSAPPNVTFCVTKRSEFVGRKNRGRLFLPIGVSESTVDEAGQLLAASVTGIQAACDAWLDDMDSAVNFTGMYILHSDISLAPSRVRSLQIQPTVRTQRRRLA